MSSGGQELGTVPLSLLNVDNKDKRLDFRESKKHRNLRGSDENKK